MLHIDSKPYTFCRFGTEVLAEQRIKLIHVVTKSFLHSHNKHYLGGSKQQEVSGVWDQGVDGTWWSIRGSKGGAIYDGDIVRLTHVQTGANLHSHSHHKSPSSKQGEVTCFGVSGDGDDNDYWQVEFQMESNKTWGLGSYSKQIFFQQQDHTLRAGSYIRLIHVNTQANLHSHFNNFTATSQQEVTTRKDRDSNDFWYIWVAA